MKLLKRKLIAIVLLINLLFFYSLAPAFVVLAQEVTPTSAPEEQTTQEGTSDPTAVTPTPTVSEQATTDPSALSPTPSLSPTPTPIPYWSDEYDVWQEEREKLDNEMEVREEEWDANEDNEVWVAEHGGSESYFVSGQWQKDQEAKAAAEAAAAAAAAATTTEEDSPSTALAQEDPFVPNTTENGGCSSSGTNVDDPLMASSDSASSALSEDSDVLGVSNSNCLAITNSTYAGGVSGQNASNYNDGPVGMNTGSASADGTLVNEGNINTTSSGDDLGAEANSNDSFATGSDAENLSTGEDTENIAVATESDTLIVDNNNEAFVDNQMTLEAVSGTNSAVGNDGDITLTTGDLELLANMLNILNLNITGDDFLHLIVNIFGTLNGTLDLDDIASALGFADDDDLEVIARNEDTGDDSKNYTEATHNEQTDINNTNNASVNNEMNVTGISGQNTVSGNDGGADVVTGRIKILANLMNFINSNFSGEKWSFIMVNIFGALNGDIIVPGTNQYLEGEGGAIAENVNPGEGSVNNASASSVNSTDVANTNDVLLTNNMNVEGVSGNNQQNGNDDGDGAHTIQSGGVDVVTQLVNFLNFNITGNNWVFLIVNVFGKWMGQIVGFADNGVMTAPTNGSFAALAVGGAGTSTQASSIGTGEDSINTVAATNTSDTNVANQNAASVTNTMNISGISGENGVNQNDAGTSLTTGWVEIDANLLNIINMNVTGRSWLVVFLNVFGDFVGNLFFGAPPVVPQVNTLAVSGVGGNSDNSDRESNQTAPASSNSSNPSGSGSVIEAEEEMIEIYTNDTRPLGSIVQEANEDSPDPEKYFANNDKVENPEIIINEAPKNFIDILKLKLMGVKLWLANLMLSISQTFALKLENLIHPILAQIRLPQV